MVLRADGSKFACQSCLKGHRVSACTHTDRELIFVPKKGRPVTQCQHCRQERKKRSSHVKCDCGETDKPHHSKEKCIHLREAEERAKAGFNDEHHLDKDPNHLSAVAEEQGCCCHHGGKCTCSQLKKEASQDGAPHGPAVKPRLEKTNSDTSITVFSNGHHKPVHRKNHAAHECGMPYKMPMPRSHTEQIVPTGARRSMDSLALDGNNNNNNQLQQPCYQPNMNGHFNNSRQSSMTEAMPAEQPTTMPPGAPSRNGSLMNGYPGLMKTATNQSMQSSATSDAAMSYAAFDSISGTTDGSFDPWSAFPSTDSMTMPDTNPFTAWSLNDNYTMVQPALTAGSSGTQSEIDEIPPSDDFFNFGMPSIQEDVGFANLDGTGNSPQMNRRSLPAGFFGNLDFTQMNPPMTNDWPTNAQMENATDPTAATTTKARPVPTSNGLNAFSSNEEAWQQFNPNMPSALSASVPQRQIFGNSQQTITGRPQSHSVGPSSAPGDDLIRQLFPDFDLNSNNASSGSSNTPNDISIYGSNVTGSPQQLPASLPTSAPANLKSSAPRPNIPTSGATATNAMDLTLMDDVTAMEDVADFGPSVSPSEQQHQQQGQSQRQWSDGSLSIPMNDDPYSPSAYDIQPPEFANEGLAEAWLQ